MQKVHYPVTKRHPKYEPIDNVQTAINMAIAEDRVIRYLTEKLNSQIKKEIIDLKDCLLRKPTRDSKEIAVVPPSVEDFCFDEEKGSIVTMPKSSESSLGR